MFRTTGLTLGGIVLLGVANLAHADDLSAPIVLPDMSLSPATWGVFSRVPENWSDLPFQLKFQERTGYNSNVLGSPSNPSAVGGVVFGSPVGSLVSISDFGVATKAYWEGQQFFADGSIGVYRYVSTPSLNSLSNSFDLGDNWKYGSRCSGQLIASERTYPSEPGQQIGFNIRNMVTTTSFNETGKCSVTSKYALIFNSGVIRTTNTATGVASLSSALAEQSNESNNNTSVFIAGGVSYNLSDMNSLELLATVTGTNYTNRQNTLSGLGLQNNILENQLNLTYTKKFSPDLSLAASIGVVGVRNGSFSLEPALGLDPIYSAQVSWAATPKLALSGGVLRTVTPATSILANLQVTESANVGLTYALTPKMAFAAGAVVSRSSGFNGSDNLVVNAFDQPFAEASTTYSANASLNYTITPFITANLSYTHTKTVQGNLTTPTDVVLLALTFNPY